MHVAVDLRILDREGMERTGLGRSALAVMRALPAVRPDWTFTVHSNRPELLAAASALRVRRTHLPTSSGPGRLAWLQVTDPSAGAPPPDLWWGPTFYAPRRWSGPAVVTVHDLVAIAHPELYRGRLRARYAARAICSSARRAQRILCPSSATRDRIVAELGVEHRKIVVAPWGVDDLFRSAAPTQATAHLLFVGRWEARKGLDVLAAALREIRRRGAPPPVLLVGGPGWKASQALGELRAMPNVQTVVDPSDEELAALYAGALALIYPSRMEGFGLPIAEAMAGGCPVIVSDLPEVREWARDAPLYVPAGDPHALAGAVIELTESAARREQMAQRGRVIASQLTWESCAEATARAMEAAVAERSGSS